MSRAFALAARALEKLDAGGPHAKGRRPKRGQAKSELDQVLRGIAGPEVPRVSELVYGVVRRQRTLRSLLKAVARRALKGRSSEIKTALELGAYALVYQGGDHAARALADARSLVSGKKAAARVERVLGEVVAALEGEAVPEGEPGAGPCAARLEAGTALPVRRGFVRLLRESILEAGDLTPTRRLAVLHSYPDELVADWAKDHGLTVAEELCRAGNDPPPLFLRACSLRTTPADLAASLAQDGVEAHPRPDLGPHCLELGGGRGAFRDTRAWRAGEFVVQDATAQEAARLLAPRPGERVLDLCAAPGTKATYLAELAGDQARILATDFSPKRLGKVSENARRLGLASIETRPADARRPDAFGSETWDAILADAPCSNTGVLRRRPEARWRYSRRSQRAIVERQSLILATALGALAPGGRLVWSVCSIELEEGPKLLEHALASRGFAKGEEMRNLPAPGRGDGGYAAVVRRA